MKKMFVLFVLFLAVVPLFAATLVKVDEVDDFGDPTGKSHLTFDQDLSGTFKNSSTSGSLQWNIVIDPKNGTAYFVLKENGKDVDVTTSARSSYYVDSSIYYTVSFKKASDGSIKTMYGKLETTETYKMNALFLYGDGWFGYYEWDCRDFFSSDESFKVSIKSDYGSYTLGTLDMSEFLSLVYDDSPYNDGIKLMEKGRYQEALKVFEEYKANDAASYAHFKTDEQVEKCKNELEKTGSYFVGRLGPSGGYVFYDCDADNESGNADGLVSSECGWRYLEATPADLRIEDGKPTVDSTASGYDSAKNWWIFGYYRTPASGSNQVIGTNTSIGSGESNTQKLVEAMGDNAYTWYDGGGTTADYAARLCSILKYEHDGVVYTDWFLPSRDELDLMYENLRRNGLGQFAAGSYWSSSESNASNAWLRYFNGGSQYDNYRYLDNAVRPIRAF